MELAELGAPNRLLALVVAGWIRYLQAETDDDGHAIEIVDAKSSELREVARGLGDDPRPFLSLSFLFGSDYFRSMAFAREVERALQSLRMRGAAQTIKAYIEIAG